MSEFDQVLTVRELNVDVCDDLDVVGDGSPGTEPNVEHFDVKTSMGRYELFFARKTDREVFLENWREFVESKELTVRILCVKDFPHGVAEVASKGEDEISVYGGPLLKTFEIKLVAFSVFFVNRITPNRNQVSEGRRKHLFLLHNFNQFLVYVSELIE